MLFTVSKIPNNLIHLFHLQIHITSVITYLRLCCNELLALEVVCAGTIWEGKSGGDIVLEDVTIVVTCCCAAVVGNGVTVGDVTDWEVVTGLGETGGSCLSVLTLRMMSGVENKAGPNVSTKCAGGLRFSLFG